MPIAISAAYILYLAYRIATAPPLSDQRQTSEAPSFAGGILLGIANPKAWVAIGAVFASAQLVDAPAADAAAKVGLLTAMIVLIMVTWLAVGGSMAAKLRDRRRARMLNGVLAVVLVVATAVAVFR